MNSTREQLLELALDVCHHAVKNGAQFAEVRASQGRSISVRAERSAIEAATAKLGMGVSIRAYHRGGQGTVSLDGLDKDDAIAAARKAAELAKLAAEDKDFKTLPPPMEGSEVEGIYDPAIDALAVPDLVSILNDCIASALETAPEAVCTGAASCSSSRSALATSTGIARSSEGSSISAWLEPIIRKGDDVGAFYDFDSARRLCDFSHEGLGASAARMALNFLGARKIPGGQMPLILGPLASGSIFGAIASGVNAESHQRGRSWLCGKVGQKIASNLLTLTDEPLIPAGLSSRAYDSEGVPCKPTPIMQDGVLLTLLHNSYTANKAGVPYTGHASGGGISASNVIPHLGTQTAGEIIRQTDRGLYINKGRVAPDANSGDVSATVDFGFYIENGELAYPVSSTMVGTTGKELLEGIDAISSDYRSEPGAIMPTVRIQSVQVAGGA